jgi:hypothetical protein
MHDPDIMIVVMSRDVMSNGCDDDARTLSLYLVIITEVEEGRPIELKFEHRMLSFERGGQNPP